MKTIKTLICKVVGHKFITLVGYNVIDETRKYVTYCERCNKSK